MNVMTVLGTRPEIIRLSRVIPLLDEVCNHTLVHTGQNYESTLSDVFFSELGVREPDVYLGVKASSFGEQLGQILSRVEEVMLDRRPEKLLVLGDTNSGLASVLAKRMGIAVFHMEAGNRCYDDRVPEEVNRRLIDHSSTIVMPYTHRSKENLLAEGFERQRIYVTGNPIKEVLDYYSNQISMSDILDRLHLREGDYFLATMHRAETVDAPQRLSSLMTALELLFRRFGRRVICSVHPRTRSRLKEIGYDEKDGVELIEPFGFFDFVRLEQSAFCIVSDSGTVQEEACILGVPNVTIRDVTERPETVEAGSSVLAGVQPEDVLRASELVVQRRSAWVAPPEYMVDNVASTVVRILLSHPERMVIGSSAAELSRAGE